MATRSLGGSRVVSYVFGLGFILPHIMFVSGSAAQSAEVHKIKKLVEKVAARVPLLLSTPLECFFSSVPRVAPRGTKVSPRTLLASPVHFTPSVLIPLVFASFLRQRRFRSLLLAATCSSRFY